MTKTIRWPNQLGWDVGNHEVLQMLDGSKAVRIFNGCGEVVKTWTAPTGMSPREAVVAALVHGQTAAL